MSFYSASPENMIQCSVLHSESTFNLNPPWKRVQGGPYGAEGGLDCTQARCISNDHHLVSCTFMMNRWMGVLPINREGGSILSFDWLEGCFSVAMIVFGMVVKDLPGFSILVPCLQLYASWILMSAEDVAVCISTRSGANIRIERSILNTDLSANSIQSTRIGLPHPAGLTRTSLLLS